MRSTVLVFLLAAVISIAAVAQQPTSDPAQTSVAPPSQSDQQPASQADQPPVPRSDEQQIQTEPMAETPVYHVNVVERTARAVDYRGRGSTKVNMRGTSLAPDVTGDADVKSHTGRFAIDVSLHHLRPARDLGPIYLTYVLWGITPEGRAVNLGEVVPNDDHNANLQVTTALQAFGLIVTAEPYFAVARPSDVVIAENLIPNDVKGWPRPIEAKFEVLERNSYSVQINPADLPATNADRKTPLSLLEARNAIAIANAAGADQYAADTMRKATDDLNRAEDYYRRKQSTSAINTVARAASQAAEDARLLTINRKQQEAETTARNRLQQRIANARSEAEAAQERAELARMKAQQEAAQRARAEEERESAERDAEMARQERAAAQQELQQAQQARADAEQQRQQLAEQAQSAQQQAQQAQLQAQQADQARLQAEQQAQEQRARLLAQLNEVLQTRETARGLVSRMPDVLFALNKATLRPDAKIKLARVAGIVMAYPDLKLEIDGYTDSTGTVPYNERLSQERAASVRGFLVSQGVPVNNVVARGFGESNPIGSNATAQGRQLNRRVELVVSGNVIGVTTQPSTTSTVGEAPGAPSNSGGTSGAVTQPAPARIDTRSGGAVAAPSSNSTTTTTTTTTPSGAAPTTPNGNVAPATPPPTNNVPPR